MVPPEPALDFPAPLALCSPAMKPNLVVGCVLLELSDLAPEEAARVTVNGQDAGGFISRPLCLDVTRWIKAGENSVRIEPFSPRQARLCVY